LDTLAQEGRIFTDAHSGSAVCTPTRYGILTGRYSWRSRLKSGVLWGYSLPLIPPERKTVASLLKNHGYTTGCVGKWHLGLGWQTTDGKIPSDRSDEPGKNVDLTKPISGGPNALGFDYFYGIPASLDMFPYVYIENDRVTAQPDRETENSSSKGFWRKGLTGSDFDHEQVLPKLTEKAVDFIDKNSHKPFFLYFPLPAPHTPILPTKDFQGKSGTNEYGDFVLQVDWTVGQGMKILKQKGISENTLFIFTSDNGCSPRADFEELREVDHHPSYIFRGHKADIYEGGHRIPFIVRWPERVKADSTSDETICLTDLIETAAAIVGEELPNNVAEDSVNILPALLGEEYKKPLREATIHHSVNGLFSIRQGKWKLEMCPGSGGWSYPRPGRDDMTDLPPIQLYDLEKDVAETTNIYDKHPDVVRELTSLLTQYVKNGRSTAGSAQRNDDPQWWKQLTWMKKNE
jgi:arylsulfatase A-like enzyme